MLNIAFRKEYNAEEAVINVQNCICKMIVEGNSAVLGIFFDSAKAFDTIDHEILIQKHGVRDNSHLLYHSSLKIRMHFIQRIGYTGSKEFNNL